MSNSPPPIINKFEYHSMPTSKADFSQLEKAPSTVALLQLKFTGYFPDFVR